MEDLAGPAGDDKSLCPNAAQRLNHYAGVDRTGEKLFGKLIKKIHAKKRVDESGGPDDENFMPKREKRQLED